MNMDSIKIGIASSGWELASTAPDHPADLDWRKALIAIGVGMASALGALFIEWLRAKLFTKTTKKTE